jgi:thiosulfate reductase cytochrome b subunit
VEARHSAVVRVTHWINASAFLALAVSGVAILLAHPRLYWGETGAIGGPSLLDLPLPMVLTGQSGWGRYLHFLAAWICVLNGMVYFAAGVARGHFRALPYQPLQRRAYLLVVFVLLPLMVWSGLAMSPAVTSVMPVIVTALGGQQSARTIHFFAASGLVVFVLGHVALVAASGFVAQMRAMITGASTVTTEPV